MLELGKYWRIKRQCVWTSFLSLLLIRPADKTGNFIGVVEVDLTEVSCTNHLTTEILSSYFDSLQLIVKFQKPEMIHYPIEVQ